MKIESLTPALVLLAQLIIPGAERWAAGSLNTVLGAGAGAEGMGGAFTAVADDSSAAFWNPAGLAQLRRTEMAVSYDRFVLDLEGSAVTVTGRLSSGFAIEQTLEAESSGDYSHVGFASVTFPFYLRGIPLTTQVSYRKLSTFPELDTVLEGHRKIVDPQGNTLVDGPYSSQIALFPAGDIYDYAVSLAGTVGRLSLGLSANLIDSTTEMHFDARENGLAVSDVWRFDFTDLSFDLGMLVRITERVSAGAVYHSGFETEATTRNEFRLGEAVQTSRVTSPVTWPSGYSVGAAFQPIENLILAIDYSTTNWADAKVGTAPFPGIFLGGQRDASSIRFGTEYVIMIADELRLPLRAGYSQEERPASLYGKTGQEPQYHSWSIGGGMGFDNVRIDFAYVSAAGTEIGSPGQGELLVPGELFTPVELPRRSTEVTSERFILSLAVHF